VAGLLHSSVLFLFPRARAHSVTPLSLPRASSAEARPVVQNNRAGRKGNRLPAMARFSLPFGSKADEKGAVDSPVEDGVMSSQRAEGIVDEDHDDLHREMKPRQLSM